MKTINLTKHGFVRCPEADFTDDGTRFTCYKVGEIRVSKTTYQGDAFIAGSYDGKDQLPYEVYSKLPHYASMDRLNCYDINRMTEEDLAQLYQDCIAYEAEYKEAFANMNWPTKEELKAVADKINAAKASEVKEIEDLIKANPLKLLSLKDSDLSRVNAGYNYLKRNLVNNVDIDKMYRTAYSCSYVEPKSVEYKCLPSYDYLRIMEILTK